MAVLEDIVVPAEVDELLTMADLCRIFRLKSKDTVRRFTRDGLPFIELGKEIRFRREHVSGWLDSRTVNLPKSAA